MDEDWYFKGNRIQRRKVQNRINQRNRRKRNAKRKALEAASRPSRSQPLEAEALTLPPPWTEGGHLDLDMAIEELARLGMPSSTPPSETPSQREVWPDQANFYEPVSLWEEISGANEAAAGSSCQQQTFVPDGTTTDWHTLSLSQVEEVQSNPTYAALHTTTAQDCGGVFPFCEPFGSAQDIMPFALDPGLSFLDDGGLGLTPLSTTYATAQSSSNLKLWNECLDWSMMVPSGYGYPPASSARQLPYNPLL